MTALPGLYPAIVTNVVDPDRMGRVEVQLPSLGQAGETVRVWATLLSPYAENDQGLQIMPSVDTQVMVAFEAGSSHRAYVIGACWNGRESMPAQATQPNDKRLLKSRSGMQLEFDDTPNAAKLTVRTKAGHTLVLDEGTREVRLTHADGFGMTLTASGAVTINANAPVDVRAPAMNVHAGTATFDGLITCQALQTNAVVSTSYTQGIGNIW